MSTYVLCFIVCDFKYTEKILEPSIGDPIKLRVYATPAQKEKTNYALEIAAKVTNYYVDYFKIAYPLPKLGKSRNNKYIYYNYKVLQHWSQFSVTLR